MTMTELKLYTSMTKARFMRHLDSTLDRRMRIFEEGRTFYLHEPLQKTAPERINERPDPKVKLQPPKKIPERRNNRKRKAQLPLKPIDSPIRYWSGATGDGPKPRPFNASTHVAAPLMRATPKRRASSQSSAARSTELLFDGAEIQIEGIENRPCSSSRNSFALAGGGDRPSPRRPTPIPKQPPDPQHPMSLPRAARSTASMLLGSEGNDSGEPAWQEYSLGANAPRRVSRSLAPRRQRSRVGACSNEAWMLCPRKKLAATHTKGQRWHTRGL